jgi:hypothetical protein
MQGHCYIFGKSKLLAGDVATWRSPIHYHGVIPHWKGIHTVKTNLRWFAVALLLTMISIPATLMADGDPNPTGGWPHIESSYVR